MLKKEDLRVGALVWFDTFNHPECLDSYNVPCVIVEVGNTLFRFRLLTEYREADCIVLTGRINGYHPTVDYMRLCAIREVRDFLERLEQRLENDMQEAVKSLEYQKKRLSDFQEQSKNFLAPYMKNPE